VKLHESREEIGSAGKPYPLQMQVVISQKPENNLSVSTKTEGMP